jgi:hypothetical protein
MSRQLSRADDRFEVERLGWRQVLVEIIMGIAITVGLALLWTLESVRNTFFGLLDRMNLKPRPRRGSAFPPGRPRKLKNTRISTQSIGASE